MNIKKFLNEQINMTNKQKLERAIALGCIEKINANLVMDPGPQPQETEDGNWAVTLKAGKGKGDTYFVFAEPMQLVNVTDVEKGSKTPKIFTWSCPALTVNDEQKKYLETLSSKGWTSQKPTDKDLDDKVYLGFDLVQNKKYTSEGYKDIVTTGDTEFNDVKAFAKYFANLKDTKGKGSVIVYKRNPNVSTFTSEQGGDCRKNIQILHDLYQKRRVEDDNYVAQVVKIVQNCVNQRDFDLRPDLRNKIKDLANINTYDREIGKLKIYLPQRESINKLIKKTLVETKEKKNNRIIENKLVESRLKFIIEDISVFNKKTKQVKIKEGFKFLRETAYLKNIGMLNENLSDVFKQMFGNSFENMLSTVSDPFVGSILNKLSIPQEIKVSVLETIKQRANELLSNMDSCENLSKFISDIVSEITMTKMTSKNITGSQFLDSAIVDTMGDDVFRTKLSEKIEEEVCVLFNKYAENAKNLVTKLTSEEV
jgi:hypothetical protein